MATAGTRGKWAEGQVKAWMKKRSEAEAGFYYYRYPDARAGSMQAVPADFGTMHQGLGGLLEVKEVVHAFRLPAKNFSPDKVARMAKFDMAGGISWVLVCHMPMKLWRVAPIDFFILDRPASWDLSRFPLHPSADAALLHIFGEKR